MAGNSAKSAPVLRQDQQHPDTKTFIEQGVAFMAREGKNLADYSPEDEPGTTKRPKHTEQFDVIVIGAGQAGLSAGYHLARLGVNFVILDANARIGDQWRQRWDSLRLFTPARFCALDGMAFPAPYDSFPTKDEMAAYLQSYANKFHLPVRAGRRVSKLTRNGGVYSVTAGDTVFEASQVIVAAAGYQLPRTPDFANALDPEITQFHAHDYRNPSQLREGSVLLVGAGNSGAEIARELAPLHHVLMAGPDVGHIPFRIDSFLGHHGLIRLVLRGVFHRLMTVRTGPGRKLRLDVLGGHSGPLVRVQPRDLAVAGVERTPRVMGISNGQPRLEDGRVLNVANVIWCTGYTPGLQWIKLPIFDNGGYPKHERGIVASEPGLTFVGLHFQYALSSAMVHGVGRDARHVTNTVAAHLKAGAAA